jgi:hypothetical protein
VVLSNNTSFTTVKKEIKNLITEAGLKIINLDEIDDRECVAISIFKNYAPYNLPKWTPFNQHKNIIKVITITNSRPVEIK